MRTRNLVMWVALIVLLGAFFSAAHVAVARKTVGLDGQVRRLDFSKSVPNKLNYQGYLADAADTTAVSGTLEITFRLYDAQTAGSELWSEVHPAVSVTSGLFSVLLGENSPFSQGLFDGSPMWLQTEVGAEVLSPRKPLVSMAYGIRAQRAEHAVRADTAAFSPPEGDWTISGDDMYSALSGNVGIGTTSPSAKLEVDAGTDSGAAICAKGAWSPPILVEQYGAGDMLRCDRVDKSSQTVFKVQNDGRIIGSILELTGGSDLSEQFDIRAASDLKPGMVVCINPEQPGELILSRKPYDHKVAGIISGAGGIEPGMLMGQSGSVANGEYPVALTGRVYCWADASNGSIRPGDLLTTSNTPGHAMKVTNYVRAQGAVIGKAMSSLAEEQGLVLVLVTLQ